MRSSRPPFNHLPFLGDPSISSGEQERCLALSSIPFTQVNGICDCAIHFSSVNQLAKILLRLSDLPCILTEPTALA